MKIYVYSKVDDRFIWIETLYYYIFMLITKLPVSVVVVIGGCYVVILCSHNFSSLDEHSVVCKSTHVILYHSYEDRKYSSYFPVMCCCDDDEPNPQVIQTSVRTGVKRCRAGCIKQCRASSTYLKLLHARMFK